MVSKVWLNNLLLYVSIALLIIGITIIAVSRSSFRKGVMKGARHLRIKRRNTLDASKIEYDLSSKFQPGENNVPWSYKATYIEGGKRRIGLELKRLKEDITYYSRNNYRIRWDKIKFHANLITKKGMPIPTNNDYINQVKSDTFLNEITRNKNRISNIYNEIDILEHANRNINTKKSV